MKWDVYLENYYVDEWKGDALKHFNEQKQIFLKGKAYLITFVDQPNREITVKAAKAELQLSD